MIKISFEEQNKDYSILSREAVANSAARIRKEMKLNT